MNWFWVLIAYSLAIVVSSGLGAVLPSLLNLNHTRLQVLISAIGGLMLGVALLHQLPHAVSALDDARFGSPLDTGMLAMLFGICAMFFLLRLSHFHHHDSYAQPGPPALEGFHHPAAIVPAGVAQAHSPYGETGHDQEQHDHSFARGMCHVERGCHGLEHQAAVNHWGWLGLVFGLSIHTLTDGIALGAHVGVEAVQGHAGWFPGFSTFLGVVLHKPLDTLSIVSLMAAAGVSPRIKQGVVWGYGLLCPLAMWTFLGGSLVLSDQKLAVIGLALAFSAGVFVCIALSDLLPEVQFHEHDKVKLSCALVAGLLLAWGIGFLEPKHLHHSAMQPSSSTGPEPNTHHHHHHPHHSETP
ncbi:MAG: iron permease [Planctomycetaceae bacterium]|nr:MAG: iron permease [Planctomycetaceae bacterium]